MFFILALVFCVCGYFGWGTQIDGKERKDFVSFCEEYAGLISFIISTSIIIFQSWWNNSIDKEEQTKNRKQSNHLGILSLKHKEKVNILEKFGGNIKYHYLGEDSIYGTMIDVLQRLKNEPEDNVNKKVLYLFLCSPVLDTPERIRGNYSDWGREFSGILTDLCTTESGLTKDNVHICFLSDEVIMGFKPLKGFVEVLANYCVAYEKKKKRKPKSAEEIYGTIYAETKRIYDIIVNKHKDKYYLRLLEDIPFQMIITETDKFAEVVVSFAGKTILEKEKSVEPKGFHSVDRDVVEAFKEIFDAYTNKSDRIPLKPLHTENIIKSTSKEHLIKNYHANTIQDILTTPIRVSANTFSPYYANSSKFTTDTLLHILKKDDKVIEIGSGSGIQVLAAYKKLVELGTSSPIIWAIEPFAIDLLRENCKGISIVTKQWMLIEKKGENRSGHCNSDTNKAVLCDKEKCKSPKCIHKKCNVAAIHEINDSYFESIKFNVILGDLPFVSADTTNASNEEMAYYDLHHDSHRILLRLFSNSNWVQKNGILITAFSTLGGYEDTNNFAQMIRDEGLVTVQYFCFLEDDYHWIIYCLMKKDDYDAANKDGRNYWKDRFGINLG